MTSLRLRVLKSKRWYERYKISITLGTILFGAFALALLVLGGFVADSISAVRSTKADLFARDLHDAISRLDLDERLTLEANLSSLTQRNRLLQPVIVPRQYYSAPQPISTATPKHPPRNCFVTLSRLPAEIPTDDKACGYFAESPNYGAFFFFVGEFTDEEAEPLRYGDRSFSADHLILDLHGSAASATWKLAPQFVPWMGKSKFLVTAFRETSTGAIELDRRVEGWAIHQPQALGRSRWTYYLRIDFREFMDKSNSRGMWPPHPSTASYGLTRVNWNKGNNPIRHQYAHSGQVDLSIDSLVAPLLQNHARVKVFRDGNTDALWTFKPNDENKETDSRLIYLTGADVNIKRAPIVRRAALPDTDILLEVSHPGVVIEKRVILLLTGAFALVLLTAFSCFYAYKRILRPIFIWTTLSKQITRQGTRALNLPFADRTDEVGTLAKSFNALLVESHRRVEREQAENDYRAEVLSLQERNFHIIGHEIRSPLQALSAIIKPDHEGRRYIERILKALPFLERVYTIEDNITNREAKLHNLDVAAFAREIVENAPLIGIELFELDFYVDVAICRVDPEAFEDVLENLIRNANRHRNDNTPITISLTRTESKVLLKVTNHGDLIAEENLPRIFDFGFSTTEGEPGRIGGIGLSISRHNILKMRGQLTVANLAPDQVQFTITLPLVAS